LLHCLVILFSSFIFPLTILIKQPTLEGRI